MVLFKLRNPQVFINKYKMKSGMAVLKNISVAKTRQLEHHINYFSTGAR
jgi:hypothetical protein